MSVLATIASYFGLTKATRRVGRGRAVADLSLWDQGGRIGGGLTPVQVSHIIRLADVGYMSSLIDLANECRQKDCHLQAVLGTSEESVAGLPWQIVVPENARAKDKRARDFVELVLRANTKLPNLIAYLAGANYYSYDVNEIVWIKDGSHLIPDDFAHLAPRRFGFRQFDGAFVLRDDGMPNDGIDFRAEWRNKFVVSQPRVNGDVPHREGLARLLVWAALFRTWTIADWLKTAELSWKPWRIGTYKKSNSNTEDRDELENVLDQLTTTGWAVKGDDATIDIEWPSGSSTTKSTHAELVNVLAQEMSKAVLGQTETTQASSSSGYGQARVHERVEMRKLEARAKQIAADLTRDLITPLIRLNFGDVIIPQFQFITEETVDLAAFGEAIEKLTKAGLRIPAKWARDQAGIPEPADDEEVIGPVPLDDADGEIPVEETPVEDAEDEKPATADKPKD